MHASKKDKNVDNNVTSWESAIYDSQKHIREARSRIRQLEKSIKVFEEMVAAGEPWPGENPTPKVG
jgi:hypothetical protein